MPIGKMLVGINVAEPTSTFYPQVICGHQANHLQGLPRRSSSGQDVKNCRRHETSFGRQIFDDVSSMSTEEADSCSEKTVFESGKMSFVSYRAANGL